MRQTETNLEDGVVNSQHATQSKEVVLEDQVVVLLVAGLVSIHEDDIVSLAGLGKLLKRAACIANVDVQFVFQPSLLKMRPDKALQVWVNLKACHLQQIYELSLSPALGHDRLALNTVNSKSERKAGRPVQDRPCRQQGAPLQ